MEGTVWTRVVLALFLVPFVTIIAASDVDEWGLEEEVPRQLVPLSDRNFEHDTQAATGQTTGSWLVLFIDQQTETCKDAERALLEAATEFQPIPSQVNVLDSPKTHKRFKVSHVPELLLFRDRCMFVYTGEWNAPSILAFIQGGWKNAVAQEVPPEATSISEFLEGLTKACQASLEYFSRRPGLLAGIGAILATAGYTVTSRMLGLSSQRKRKVV